MSKIKDFFNLFRHRYYELGKALMFVLAIVLIYWQLPRVVKFGYEYQLFKPWQHETLYAPFDFPIYKDEEMLKVENEEALKSVKPIFQFDKEATQQSRARLEAAFDREWRSYGLGAEANKAVLLELFDQIQERGVVAYDKALEGMDEATEVRLVKDRKASVLTYGDLYTMTTAREAVEQWMKQPHPGIDVRLV